VHEVEEYSKHGTYFMFWDNKELIGCVNCKVTLHDDSNSHLFMGHLSISPKYQSAGIGTGLVTFAENFGKQQGCNKVQIDVVSVKPWLQQWYRDKGYTETGKTSEFPLHLLKIPCHFIEMEKRL